MTCSLRAMVRSIWFALVLVLAACGGKAAPAPVAPDPGGGGAPSGKLSDPTAEPVGDLMLGNDAAAVEQGLGAPESKGEVEEWAATGDFVSTWAWPAQGLSLDMAAASADGAPSVLSITVTPPATLKTKRGIGIGSSRADTRAAYQEYLGAGHVQDEPLVDDAERLIVGSVYGGIFFEFADDKVVRIFVGAGAE